MSQKIVFIPTSAIPMIEVDGGANIPTVLYYKPNGGVLIGSAALAEADEDPTKINANFKLDLGLIDPKTQTPREKFPTAAGDRKSAVGLAADFLYKILEYTQKWLDTNNVSEPANILLAEPLSLGSSGELTPESWLPNYRRNLQRILTGRFFEKASIDFLPEPFAVFQYYRYGLAHPLLTPAQRTKHNALVMDFGGGTFDVCIIETTREGDISQTGKNSKPLAAASDAVGGFFINRIIAEELLRKQSNGKRKDPRLDKAIDLYRKWRSDPDVEPDLATRLLEYRNFVENFHRLVFSLDRLKLALCAQITDWRLDAPLTATSSMSIPSDLFANDSNPISIKFSAIEFRDLFLSKVWPRLKSTVKRTFQRGEAELQGHSITVVLLSGGSANIRWLEHLLKRDFAAELKNAQFLCPPNYQEVVAKGLAVECTRRFFDSQSDFSSVAYNRLCLILDSDRHGHSPRVFIPRTKDLPEVKDKPGVLLPSASALKHFIDKPLLWRVHLDRPPKQRLDYFFLRSSTDPGTTENLHNLAATTVFTPKNPRFDNSIQIQLIVNEDGTARPSFIYKQGRTEDETVAVSGNPFYLDMTFGKATSGPKAYIGFDFGTSNTAISFVDQTSVQTYQRRSAEASWNTWEDLVPKLPYPLATPLARYLSQRDTSQIVKHAREFIEAALAIAGYVVYVEYCLTSSAPTTKLFKSFTQRSAGPLWALLKDTLRQLGSKAILSAPYMELLTPQFFEPVDNAVSFIALEKHDKTGDREFNHTRICQILANVNARVFHEGKFGFFEQVRKKGFSTQYEGLFRQACGLSPFIKSYRYLGKHMFSNNEAFVIHEPTCTAIPLKPLVFWDHCTKHPDVTDGHCYLFDGMTKERQASFKAAAYPCSRDINDTEDGYGSLVHELRAWRESDPNLERYLLDTFSEG